MANGFDRAIDTDALGRELGVPVVPVVATKGTGIERLKRAVFDALDKPPSGRFPEFPDCVGRELEELSRRVDPGDDSDPRTLRVELLQTLLDPGGYHERRPGPGDPG